jgi:hypothetical protein
MAMRPSMSRTDAAGGRPPTAAGGRLRRAVVAGAWPRTRGDQRGRAIMMGEKREGAASLEVPPRGGLAEGVDAIDSATRLGSCHGNRRSTASLIAQTDKTLRTFGWLVAANLIGGTLGRDGGDAATRGPARIGASGVLAVARACSWGAARVGGHRPPRRAPSSSCRRSCSSSSRPSRSRAAHPRARVRAGGGGRSPTQRRVAALALIMEDRTRR